MAFVRTQPCCAGPWDCWGDMVAHHVRNGTGAGTSQKPGDEWCVPLCHGHHIAIHQHGHVTFETKHKVALIGIAKRLWEKSPVNK